MKRGIQICNIFEKEHLFYIRCNLACEKKIVRNIMFFLGIKHSTSILVQTKKKTFFAKFCSKFLTFLHFFSYFEQKCYTYIFRQRLECAAPKCWSKYTTLECNWIESLTSPNPLCFALNIHKHDLLVILLHHHFFLGKVKS